ncbi:MAG: NAD(P) transhydrogenase subunit alpha [Chitinophagaceae bacterium]|nr:NAD(P) transhydrogenase subunit alpha [Chitinophagaceae bacterium]
MESILDFISTNQQIIYIVILMIFVGIEVIGHVPSVLHTPLMSGANAIHGVVIIGAIIVMGKAETDNFLALALGFLAVILGTLNVVGGFVVTDRMLEMFKSKNPKSQILNSKMEEKKTLRRKDNIFQEDWNKI